MLTLPHRRCAIVGMSPATLNQLLREHWRMRMPAFQGYGAGEMS